jgi:predicted nucleic acid-binding Zn ribbon protein
MPTYTMKCKSCKNGFDQSLTFKEYDEFKEQGEDQLIVKCPECFECFAVERTFDMTGITVIYGKGFFSTGGY